MAGYQLFTDATADHSEKMLEGFPNVKVIPMEVKIGGHTYTYGPHGNLSVQKFYEMQREGKFATTSQINPQTYFEQFEPSLREGKDILYLCFSSGMSGTLQSAMICRQELQQKYPDRSIFCVDTLAASIGEGFLVREAARKQAEGFSFDELFLWVMEHRLKVCHWFTVDVFEHLKFGGRVSSATTAMGTLLNIKPLLHVDDLGKLAVTAKPRGRKQSIEKQVSLLEQGWDPSLGKLVVVGHGDCFDGAQQLKKRIHARIPEAEIMIADIGPIIGAHTGPGMLAITYWGNNR